MNEMPRLQSLGQLHRIQAKTQFNSLQALRVRQRAQVHHARDCGQDLKDRQKGGTSMSLSNHQIFMLKHFAMGWRFKLDNKKPGSLSTYWSLRRRGLVDAGSVVTDQGRKVLAKELQLQAKRESK